MDNEEIELEFLPKSPVRWQAPEYLHTEKRIDWFWAIAIIGLAGAVLAFFSHNFFFGAFLLISTILIMILRGRGAEIINYEINKDGIKFGPTFYEWGKAKGYWLEDEGEINTLYIQLEKSITPILVMHYTDDSLTEELDVIFQSNKIEETYLHEPVSHQIFERLGF